MKEAYKAADERAGSLRDEVKRCYGNWNACRMLNCSQSEHYLICLIRQFLDAEPADNLPEEVPREDLPEIGAMTMSPADGMLMHDGTHDHVRPQNRHIAYRLQILRIKGESRHLKPTRNKILPYPPCYHFFAELRVSRDSF